jgi:3-deoxy-D-manno-octulosonic-acid transferase
MLLLWLYDAGIALYVMALHIAAGFHPKARKWVQGRVNWESRLQNQIAEKFIPGKARLWMHCASLGEFEQGRPVLEAWRNQHPDSQILLTFFSPSGYEIRKDYPGADIVTYLPADTPRAARRFVELVQPDLVIFVKYEFWLRILQALFLRNIPVLLISAVFRPGQIFFKWYGGLWKKVLSGFQHIFVQDAASLELLQQHGIQTCSIAGDTRVDRVVSIAEEGREIEIVKHFTAGHRTLIAGSTWPPDEELLAILLRENLLPDWKFIIAPHQISESNLQRIESLLPSRNRKIFHHQRGASGSGCCTADRQHWHAQRPVSVRRPGLHRRRFRNGHSQHIGTHGIRAAGYLWSEIQKVSGGGGNGEPWRRCFRGRRSIVSQGLRSFCG